MPVDSGLVQIIARQNEKKKEDRDPFNLIMKGLSVANQVYGIKGAADKMELMKLSNQQGQKQTEFSNKAELAAKGLMIDEAGNIVDDPNSSFYKMRMRKNEPDQTAKSIKELQLQALQQKKDESKQGKMLPASEAVNIGGANASFKALEEASKAFESNKDISGPYKGMISKGQGFFEIGDVGRRAKAFDAQTLANAQIIGKYLEGGKMTDSDIDRYKKILPNIGDSPEVAQKKIIIVQNLIAQKQQSEKQALEQAGYNTKSLNVSDVQEGPNVRKNSGKGEDLAEKILLQRQGLKSAIPKGK